MIIHGTAKAELLDIYSGKICTAELLDKHNKKIYLPNNLYNMILKRLNKNWYKHMINRGRVIGYDPRVLEFTYIEIPEGVASLTIRNHNDKIDKQLAVDICEARALKAVGIKRTRKRIEVDGKLKTIVIEAPRPTYIEIYKSKHPRKKIKNKMETDEEYNTRMLKGQSPFVVML